MSNQSVLTPRTLFRVTQRFVFLVLLSVMLLIASLVSCDLIPPDGSQTNGNDSPSPSGYQQFTPTPSPVPFVPVRVIQACLDTPPIYPANLFQQAVNTIASWIDQNVANGQGGFIIFFGFVKGQSYDSAAFPPIIVPALSSDEPPPTPMPPSLAKPGESPYHIADLQATVDAKNSQAYVAWQRKEALLHTNRAAVESTVKKQTEKLRSLAPVFDDTGADQYGCLQEAATHFSSYHSENYLILASSYVNNISVNWTPDLSLVHAHVRGIYTFCSPAPLCQERESTWKDTFLRLGAAPDIAFYDSQQSSILAPQF